MKRTFVLLTLLICALGIFIPAAYAGPIVGCTPEGSALDDTIVCAADDADGVNTGAGTDVVTITGGTVLDSIIAEGVQITVIVNGGALDTTIAERDAIAMPFGGKVIFQQGSLTAGHTGIAVYTSGSVVSMGEIAAVYRGIFLDGDGSINNSGDVTVDNNVLYYTVDYSNTGLVVVGSGTIDNTGKITVTYENYYGMGSNYGMSGIMLGGGTINNSGDISVHYDGIGYIGGIGFGGGIVLYNGGVVNNSGSIDTDGIGILATDFDSVYGMGTSTGADVTVNNSGDISGIYGIYSYASGNQVVNNTGNIHLNTTTGYLMSYGMGIYVWNYDGMMMLGGGNAVVNNSGNIDGNGFGIYVGANGSIVNSGTITLDDSGYMYLGGFGIYLEGNGTIDSQGAITTSAFGIFGGMGDQVVDVSANVNAPIAVSLGGGNDTVTVHPFIVINGDIEMGDGDDIVRLANNAVVNGTIYGGETGEVNGDLLIIGVGQVCGEDAEAIQDAIAGLGDVNADAGTITYLGQTYTWAEFEMLGHEGTVGSCVGKIDDGRVNAYDLGAPEALYCTVDQGISVWELDLEGQGTFSFAVTQAQINAASDAAVASGVNTLIGSDSFGNELYAISDGTTITFVSPELRESGKQYLYSFNKTTCETA